MKIETKFDIWDTVWIVAENELHRAIIVGVQYLYIDILQGEHLVYIVEDATNSKLYEVGKEIVFKKRDEAKEYLMKENGIQASNEDIPLCEDFLNKEMFRIKEKDFEND